MVKSQKTVSTSQLVTVVGKNINETFEKKGLSIPQKLFKDIIQGFLTIIKEKLAGSNKLRLDKIGILQVKDRAARKGRNPQTGEEIKIPASKKISFRAAKSLKEKVTGIKKVGVKKTTKAPQKTVKKKK